MKIMLGSPDGKSFVFKNLYSIEISQEYYAAGAVKCSFFIESDIPVCNRVTVIENGEKLFYGVVDSQVISFSSDGKKCSITGRDLSGILLDNEAAPMIYESVSLDEIYSAHIKPYGISNAAGGGYFFGGTLSVSKGMSEYDVAAKFCSLAGIGVPFCNSEGALELRKSKRRCCFGSDVPLVSIEKSVLLYKPLSEMILADRETHQYMHSVKNQAGLATYAARRRYRSFSMLSSGEQTGEAKKLLLKSNCGSTVYKIVTAGSSKMNVGDLCSIKTSVFNCDSLTVYSKRYCLSAEGIFTEFELVPTADIY